MSMLNRSLDDIKKLGLGDLNSSPSLRPFSLIQCLEERGDGRLYGDCRFLKVLKPLLFERVIYWWIGHSDVMVKAGFWLPGGLFWWLFCFLR